MSDCGALYTARDWRPVCQRVGPLAPESGLLLRVLLIRHRRQPQRAVLISECLRRGENGQEMVNLGGSALEMVDVSSEVCRHLFDKAVARLLESDGE